MDTGVDVHLQGGAEEKATCLAAEAATYTRCTGAKILA